MNCTNPNCECKPGTFANMNPPTKAPSPVRFEVWMLSGIEWQQRIPIQTDNGKYRVEITWALDRYRVSVSTNPWACSISACALMWRRVQEPEKLIEVRHPLFARTAVETANILLRKYNRFA